MSFSLSRHGGRRARTGRQVREARRAAGPELPRERGPLLAARRLERVGRRERARQQVQRQPRVALRLEALGHGLLDVPLQDVVGRRREAAGVVVVRRRRLPRRPQRVLVREALVAPDALAEAHARSGRRVARVARELGVAPHALRGRRAQRAPVDGRAAVADPAPRERRPRPAAVVESLKEAVDEGDAVGDAEPGRGLHELEHRAVDQRRAGRVPRRGEAGERRARDDERPVALAGPPREREAPALDTRRTKVLEAHAAR